MALPRERLTALLSESALTSVELVVAPPGYGKTTVLREYAAGDPSAVYITLPEITDLEAFVRAIIAAAVPSGLRSVGAVFTNLGGENIEERAGDWLTSRLRAFNGTLLIDDFHRASKDERVARVLVAVITATHGRMRWIVASRQAPAFPMGSWIARGWTGLPITSDDLAFTSGEGGALATSLGIDASEEEIAAVLNDTLGWPLGVRLALSLVSRHRGERKTRIQTREALFSLIDEEVWKPLDPHLRRLAAAAVLIPSPRIETLLAAGFDDARSSMAELFARVPFITSIDDDAFAIHDLFREFVSANVATESAGGAVVQRVGSALVDGGNPADGLRLLIVAGQAADVEAALAIHGFDLLETGQRGVVNAAMAFLGEHSIDDTGVTLAIRAALAFADGSASNSTNLFVRASQHELPPVIRGEVSRRLALSYANRGMLPEALQTLSPLENDQSISLEERLEVRAMAASFRANGPDRAAVEIAIREIEAQIPLARANVQARVLQRLGLAAFYLGDVERAEGFSLDAALLATELGIDTVSALAYGTLQALTFQGDLDTRRALSFSRSQAAAAERAANAALHVYALRAQYIFAAHDMDFDEARSLDTTLSGLVDAHTYQESFIYKYAKALLYVCSGDVPKAEATLRSVPSSALSGGKRLDRDAFLIVLLLLRGKRSAALAELERPVLTKAPDDVSAQIEMANAYALRGVAYWVLDRPAQARRAFEFHIAELPPRYELLRRTLKAFCVMQHPLPNAAAADSLIAALSDANFRAYGELLRRLVDLDTNDVALSAAELETLREFDRYGGRAVDVAKALGKSKFTIQNQIQSAIKKLGCSGRAEALAYARQRGWLDRTPD